MYKKAFILGLITLSFISCSRIHKITYLSSPPGAVITCDEERLGYAPITKKYKLNDSQKELELPACEAHWVSDAKATMHQKVIVVGSRINSSSKYLFQRPEHPDYDKDEIFALKQKKVREIEKRNAIAQERQEEQYSHYDDYRYGGGYYGGGYYDGGGHGGGVARMTVP